MKLRLIFNMIGKKFCPRCDSEDIEVVAGGTTGMWMCRECGFTSPSFPEKTIIGKSASEDEDYDDFDEDYDEELDEEFEDKKIKKAKAKPKKAKKKGVKRKK